MLPVNHHVGADIAAKGRSRRQVRPVVWTALHRGRMGLNGVRGAGDRSSTGGGKARGFASAHAHAAKVMVTMRAQNSRESSDRCCRWLNEVMGDVEPVGHAGRDRAEVDGDRTAPAQGAGSELTDRRSTSPTAAQKPADNGTHADIDVALAGDDADSGPVDPSQVVELDASVDEFRPEDSPELFIGIARPLGTPTDVSLPEMMSAFDEFGYTVIHVKISQLLTDSFVDVNNRQMSTKFDERTVALIGEGNRLCAEAVNDAAVVDMAISEIRRLRPDEGTEGSNGPEGVKGNAKSMRRVFLIDSLKRPAEVLALRKIYGDHFILVGLQASEKERSLQLRADLATRGTHSGTDAKTRAATLMQMDNQGISHGQHMTTTLAMSDVFVRVDVGDHDPRHEARRFVELLFGDPKAKPPTLAEYAMNLARQTSFRSPELGLRVGAALVSKDGDVLATGFNHHPTSDRAPDYDFSAVDLQGLARNTMTLLADAGRLTPTEEAALATDPDTYIRDLLEGPLKNSQLRGVTEYQRPVHAEMDALLSALRQRVDVDGATIYVTDFPCHGCARHLIAMKLNLVYLMPYTKSRAADMYGDETDRFVPFTGVTPSRYQQWFGDGLGQDRKDAFGKRRTWSKADREQAMPSVDAVMDNRVIDDRESGRAKLLTDL